MSVTDWSPQPSGNALADPSVKAAREGAAARDYSSSFRGIMAKTAALALDQGGALVSTGTGNTYEVATNSGISALRPGVSISFRADRDNTAAPSINVDGSGPRPWLSGAGDPLPAGAVKAGRLYTVAWNEVSTANTPGWSMVVAPLLGVGDVPGLPPLIGDLANRTGVISFVPQGTQDGNPTLDQRGAIQVAWDAATEMGLPLLVSAGDAGQTALDVRINGALRGARNKARIIFDKRVRLHAYSTNFTGTTYDLSDATIGNSVGIYFGPPPGSPNPTYISDVGIENVTFVYHPPTDGQGSRIPSLNTFMAVYIDRCVRPRARSIDVSGLNAGFGFAFTSCRDVDFDGIIVHDCAMVLDTSAVDPATQNKQLSGINADDFWSGRGIDPTVGGSVRNVRVYNLTSNRTTKQVDGVTDQGSRGVTWLGAYISGCDEGLDSYGTGSIYSDYIFADCTCPVKVGHGAYDVVINAKAVGGSSTANGGRAAVLVFAGNRRNTSKVSINLDISDFRSTRLVEVNSDNPNGVAANGSVITTKVEDLAVNVTARNCRAARAMTEGGTGAGNVYSIDIDAASVASSIAEGFTASESEFMQVSQNPASRVRIGRGANTRPIAATAAAARSQGATYSSGYYHQQNGTLQSLAGWAELDLVHGQTGTGILRRIGAGNYEFLTYETGTWTPALSFATAPTGLAYAEQTGRYTKVGNVVTVQGRLTLSSRGAGGSGAARLIGLPFASNGFSTMGLPRYNFITLPSGYVLNGFINGTAVSLQGTSNAAPIDAAYSYFENSSDIMFSFSYLSTT